MRQMAFDAVALFVFDTREEMGRAAAGEAAAALREILAGRDEANVVFAAAPSQNELLASLCGEPEVDWKRVNAFHMDEYIGLEPDDPRRFAAFLDEAVFTRLPFRAVHRMDGRAEPEAECRRYGQLLRASPPDLVLMGIGENGHIAFNDPPADFDDARLVKVVELDRACRQQQVNDKCFDRIDQVPTHAVTLTIPALANAGRLVCVVPGERKARAVADALSGPVTPDCPASVLRRAPGRVRMYVDRDAASLLEA